MVQCLADQVTIDILPDNVLLEIFHFYKEDLTSIRLYTWCWIRLIHVCRRWRHIIFGSPRRLNLRLVCSERTPVRKSLDIWPPFPIIILSNINQTVDEECPENVAAALECRQRTSYIRIFDGIGSTLKRSIAAMLEPFPVLTQCSLILTNNSVSMPVLPETFLGGSSPHLESFTLRGIPFPTFPNFVLSSTQIQSLSLENIPHSGYISPDAMVTCLAALPNLRRLSIGFQSPLSRPAEIAPPPLTRAMFPNLIGFYFRGVSEYLEDFIARIEAPHLFFLTTIFFMDLIFDIPRLHNFINRTLKRVNQASMVFTSQEIKISFAMHIQQEIQCERLDWQLSSITQILSQQLPLLSPVEYFEICEPQFPLGDSRIEWEDDPDMDPSQWLELFRLLIAVRSLYVSERLVHRVVAALKELTGEMAMEVLPALRSLWLEGLQPFGLVQDAIKSFVTARQLTNHPVTVQPWKRPTLGPIQDNSPDSSNVRSQVNSVEVNRQ
jgi:F-box-like